MALSWEVKTGGAYRTSASGKMYQGKTNTSRIFAKYSRPAKARPFMQKIVERSQDDITKLFQSAQDSINRTIANQTK
jgi:hypothetical protein